MMSLILLSFLFSLLPLEQTSNDETMEQEPSAQKAEALKCADRQEAAPSQV